MKSKMLIWCACAMVFLAGCSNQSTDVSSTSSNETPVETQTESDLAVAGAKEYTAPSVLSADNEAAEVVLELKMETISATGLVIVLRNDSGETYTFGDDFIIERLVDGTWYQEPEAAGNAGFDEGEYSLEAGQEIIRNIEWDGVYGSLEPGDCRILVRVVNNAGITQYVAAEFTAK